MKRILILLSFAFWALNGYGQTYAYSFEGDLTPTKITDLENSCSDLEGIGIVKIKYKDDSNRGEFIVQIDKSAINKRGAEDGQFSASDLKSFIINSGLSPLEFRKLAD